MTGFDPWPSFSFGEPKPYSAAPSSGPGSPLSTLFTQEMLKKVRATAFPKVPLRELHATKCLASGLLDGHGLPACAGLSAGIGVNCVGVLRQGFLANGTALMGQESRKKEKRSPDQVGPSAGRLQSSR
eukprot:COSAG04_NODE_9054_length_903_cov_2.645522_2_plen_128_part_00